MVICRVVYDFFMDTPFHEVSQNETPKIIQVMNEHFSTYGDDWGSTILGNPHITWIC